MRAPCRPWTTKDVAIVRRDYPFANTRQMAQQLGRSIAAVISQARKQGVKKHPDFTEAEPFIKGGKPWNTGKCHNPEGWRPYQFKAGHQSPSWMPIGSEVVGAGGMLLRKVTDTGKRYTDWHKVKDIVRRELHGEIPPKHFVVMGNGDGTDVRPENLLLVNRAQNIQRNAPRTEEGKRAAALRAWESRRRKPITNEVRA